MTGTGTATGAPPRRTGDADRPEIRPGDEPVRFVQNGHVVDLQTAGNERGADVRGG